MVLFGAEVDSKTSSFGPWQLNAGRANRPSLPKRRGLRVRSSMQLGSEFDLLGHPLAMLVAKVPVGFHGQSAAIFVSQPPTHRWNVDAGFNAPCREQMPKVM